SGLGWGARLLVDGGRATPFDETAPIRTTVRSLPGLLGVDLGQGGGIRVQGGRVESIGTDPITLYGSGDGEGSLLMLPLDPGRATTIAPPPFAPFERRLLPPDTLRSLIAEVPPARPHPTLQRQTQSPATVLQVA